GSLRGFLSWSGRDSRNVRLLSGAHVLGFGFMGRNRTRQQSSRQSSNQVFRLGSSKFPGFRDRQVSTTLTAVASLERRQNTGDTCIAHREFSWTLWFCRALCELPRTGQRRL